MVWGGGCLEDLATGAEALVREPGRYERRKYVGVDRQTLGLAHGFAVPLQAECGEVSELALLGAWSHAIKVLDPDDEVSAGPPGPQPREQSRTQVAHVQVARRRRCESSSTHVVKYVDPRGRATVVSV